MTAVRLVSISTRGRSAIGRRRIEALRDVEVTVLPPGPGVGAALEGASADVVHLDGEPGTRLAGLIARICARQGRALLLETDGVGGRRLARSARATVARASAAIGRSPDDIAALRRLGLRGAGVVALPDVDPEAGLTGLEARERLEIPPQAGPVIGWCALTDEVASVQDFLETLALSRPGAIGVVAAPARLRDRALDIADALELLPRLRLTEGTAWLPAADLLVAAAGRSAIPAAVPLVAEALALGIPVVHDPAAGLGPLVGAAGWAVPGHDPVLLARLLDRLAETPALRAAAAAATAGAAAESAGLFAHAVLAAAERPRPTPRRRLEWIGAVWADWTHRPLAKRP